MTERSYSELIKRETFLSRFRYLELGGSVGVATFGLERHLNQAFYASRQWKDVIDVVRIRDNDCDLGVPGYEMGGRVLVHHMNPMTVKDLVDFNPKVLDPEYLISVSHRTHNAIHFADERQLPRPLVERRPGDTIGWERKW